MGRFRSMLLPFSLALTALILSCSSSKEMGRKGWVRGLVEQRLHHGAYNPDGPNETITPLSGIALIVADTAGVAIDTIISGAAGMFSAELTTGTYVITLPERKDELVPGSSPEPERVIVRPGDTTTLRFRYDVYAP